MAKKYFTAEETVGNTPLVRLTGIEKRFNLSARIFGKLEAKNPTGSVKDRAALYMLRDLEERKLISRGGRIIEATSGNMGISIAFLSAIRGYRATVVMPRSASPERQKIIRALGAELVLTEGGMAEAVLTAGELLKEGGISLKQFENPMNSYAHEATTGPEIYRDSDGCVDMLVCGVGTGGTISGAGRYLKSKSASVKIVAVEPSESAILSGGASGKHRIQGIGAGFLPTILDKNVIDQVFCVSSEQAEEGMMLLAREDGILSGISSGAAIFAAISLGQREENREKNIVAILPDGIEKYLSCLPL